MIKIIIKNLYLILMNREYFIFLKSKLTPILIFRTYNNVLFKSIIILFDILYYL